MSYSKKVYCESLFLETMCKAAEEDSPIKYEEKKVWRALYFFLRHGIFELHIEGDEIVDDFHQCKRKIPIDLKRTSNSTPLYEELAKRLDDSTFINQGQVQSIFDYTPMNKESELLDKEGMYLTMLDEKTVDAIAKRTGCFIISPETIHYLEPLTNDNGLPISKRSYGTWKKVFENSIISEWGRIPCNRITIIDNYILSKVEELKDNLEPILDSLLPNHLRNRPFPLTIISDGYYNFETTWSKVKEIVEGFKRPYPIDLCMVKCSDKTFHDRTILTDNIWISSGAGFNLYKRGKAGNSTIISIVSPFLNDKIKWASQAYYNLRNEIEKTLKNCSNYEERFKTYPLLKNKSIIMPTND